jgi:MerR family transcriptional regulator, light-induced transcriptional regulator
MRLATTAAHGQQDDQPDAALYTVRAVAQRLGVPTATLRSWTQRYGIGASGRSPGRHRLYSSADIAVVEAMHELIGKGVPPGSAARAALDSVTPRRADTAPLVTAAFSLDSAAAGRLLEGHIRHFGVLDTWDELVRPTFAAISARQDGGDACIDVEHALSWTVSHALQRVSNLPAGTPASVILACTAGEVHTLALEALRAALDERGVGALMLGANVPGPALIDAIERQPARRAGVVLWSSHGATADIASVRGVVTAGVQLFVAGPGWASVKLPRTVQRIATLQAALGHLEHTRSDQLTSSI